MKKRKITIFNIILIISSFVFIVALVSLIYGDELDQMFNVIGIRIATLFVAFAAFCSTTTFSFLVYNHNRIVSRVNDDNNRRAEMFRELQFASSNYSIIEFMDRMLLYDESSRYVEKFIYKKSMLFHMMLEGLSEEDIFNHPENYAYISIRIPFRVVEGKVVSNINFKKLKFDRGGNSYVFVTPPSQKESRSFILYNEHTKRNNVIMNLIVKKDSDFFISSQVNVFSKIKISIGITSLLGVKVKGITEISFTNPEQIEGDGTNTYKINSSNFLLIEMPQISESFSFNPNTDF